MGAGNSTPSGNQQMNTTGAGSDVPTGSDITTKKRLTRRGSLNGSGSGSGSLPSSNENSEEVIVKRLMEGQKPIVQNSRMNELNQNFQASTRCVEVLRKYNIKSLKDYENLVEVNNNNKLYAPMRVIANSEMKNIQTCANLAFRGMNLHQQNIGNALARVRGAETLAKQQAAQKKANTQQRFLNAQRSLNARFGTETSYTSGSGAGNRLTSGNWRGLFGGKRKNKTKRTHTKKRHTRRR
jgi:hypothetical protein